MGFSPDRLLQVLQSFPQPRRYWVAYSGGLDSSVLLHAMAALRTDLPASLLALHLDHALQADSSQWTQHCREQCTALDVALETRALQVNTAAGSSLEAEARAARLDAFQACMEPGDMLLTAQHQDDQAETLLLQLLRGSGPSGLAGMPAVSAFPPGWLARPLLDFTRQQLKDYALREQVPWVDDPSNAETNFDRNYLRHRVLPSLRERWPSCGKTLSRSARLCAEAQHLNDALADREMALASGSLPGSLSVHILREMEPSLCRVLLRRWIKNAGFLAPSSRKLAALMSDLLPAATDRSPLVCWKGAELRRYRDDLHLMAPLPPPPGQAELSWRLPAELALPPGLGRLRIEPVDADSMEPRPEWRKPLRVCFGVPAGSCRIVGSAHRKSLKKLYQEQGVPDWVRPYVPLVFDGDVLLTVGGCWQCQALDSKTRVFRVNWEGHAFTRFLQRR